MEVGLYFMKHNNRFLLFSSILFASLIINVISKDIRNEVINDPITYEEATSVSLDNPYRLTQIKKEEKARLAPNKLTIHYYNDDGKCGDRQIYVWSDSRAELYLKPTSAEDGKSMVYTIDYSLDEFKTFLTEKKLNFIIKFGPDNYWDGQSEDSFIYYDQYDVVDGVMEVYVTPGIGNSLDIFKDYESTQRPKIDECYFDDWKTIHCKAKATPLNVAVYAFDETYYSLSEQKQSNYDYKNKYLIGQFNPTSEEFDINLKYTMHLNCTYVLESIYQNYIGITQTTTARCEYLYNPVVGYENNGTRVPADTKHVKNLTRFNKFYTYSGELGAIYTKEKTTFRLWAPTTSYAILNIYSKGSSSERGSKSQYKMWYQPGGIWEVEVIGDCNNLYYTYTITNQAGTNEIIDPYAKGCGLDGKRGYIYDSALTNPDGWDDIPSIWDGNSTYDISSPQDLVIYESHIRDLTMDESWNGTSTPGTYVAYIEKGTRLKTNSSITTGFDHLEELGVNAIQLLPIFDQDNSEIDSTYNWGYNPLNYFCLEGSYSTDPSNGLTRIKEFKELVKAFANNKNHTRIIMDSVFNHVSSASSHVFNKVMPKYYFRYDSDWNLMNGAGCGNEIRSEAPMMRKYIVDCMTFWAQEYKIKGFRLDLMGLLDSGTLREVKDTLYEIDPDIYVYGEGWTSGGYHGTYNSTDGGTDTWRVYNKLQPTKTSPGRIGCFNDAGRNALKGENSIDNAWGFISQGSGDVGNKADIVGNLMQGIHTGYNAIANPELCINYASCHDNFTLFDQLNWTLSDDGGRTAPDITTVAQALIAVEGAIVTSNGVAFIHGGEEVFRTKIQDEADKDTVVMYGKNITHNSYKSSDETNSYKWDRKASIDGKDMTSYFEAYKNLIKERKNMKKYSKSELGSITYSLNSNKTLIRLNAGSYELFFQGRDSSSISASTSLNFVCNNLNTQNGYTYSSNKMSMNKYMFVIMKK